MNNIERFFNTSSVILTEGGVAERLKHEFGYKTDKFINHAGAIYSDPIALEMIYRQYIDIAQLYNLPIMLMTPTRKVNKQSVQKSEFNNKNLIHDSVIFLKTITESYKEFSSQILIGGLLGCQGDAYSPEVVLGTKESYDFHKNQSKEFEDAGVDYLFAGIMPEINEAVGMAKAMAETAIPYIISFMIRQDGCLIDGTPISTAIRIIDQEVVQKPFCYMTNCVHPTNLRLALINDVNRNLPELNRFKGIQANASILSPEELNNSSVLQQNDFSIVVDEMLLLYKQFGLKILGGCCGTNDVFIDKLARKITEF